MYDSHVCRRPSPSLLQSFPEATKDACNRAWGTALKRRETIWPPYRTLTSAASRGPVLETELDANLKPSGTRKWIAVVSKS